MVVRIVRIADDKIVLSITVDVAGGLDQAIALLRTSVRGVRVDLPTAQSKAPG